MTNPGEKPKLDVKSRPQKQLSPDEKGKSEKKKRPKGHNIKVIPSRNWDFLFYTSLTHLQVSDKQPPKRIDNLDLSSQADSLGGSNSIELPTDGSCVVSGCAINGGECTTQLPYARRAISCAFLIPTPRSWLTVVVPERFHGRRSLTAECSRSSVISRHGRACGETTVADGSRAITSLGFFCGGDVTFFSVAPLFVLTFAARIPSPITIFRRKSHCTYMSLAMGRRESRICFISTPGSLRVATSSRRSATSRRNVVHPVAWPYSVLSSIFQAWALLGLSCECVVMW